MMEGCVGWSQAGQSPTGTGLVKGFKEQEMHLKAYQSEKESPRGDIPPKTRQASNSGQGES